MINKIVLSSLFVGLWAGTACAQLFLEDGKKVLSVSGGEHLNGSLLIHNTSADPAEVRVYWEDFEYKPPYDGTKNFLPQGTAPESASQWVSYSPQQFTMPPYGQQKLVYTVTVPSVIQQGHYGVLFFERSSGTPEGQDGVTLVTRVGCLFFIEPKDKNKNASLEHIALKGNQVTADFVNQGNVILIPNTTYYIMQDGGMVVLRGQISKRYVPPGVSATLEIPIKDQLKQGQYSLVVNCDLGDGDVTVKEIKLTVDAAGQLTINSQD